MLTSCTTCAGSLQAEAHYKLHIYHFRSPSIEDALKKIVDWNYWEIKEGEEELMGIMSDESYEKATWFFNQVKDISMTRFGPALRERMAPLLSPSTSQHRL